MNHEVGETVVLPQVTPCGATEEALDELSTERVSNNAQEAILDKTGSVVLAAGQNVRIQVLQSSRTKIRVLQTEPKKQADGGLKLYSATFIGRECWVPSLTVSISATVAPRPVVRHSRAELDSANKRVYTDPGITKANFDLISTRMSYSEVKIILGSPGEEISESEMAGTRTVMYQWKGGSGGGNMNAMFQNDHLISKAQSRLR